MLESCDRFTTDCCDTRPDVLPSVGRRCRNRKLEKDSTTTMRLLHRTSDSTSRDCSRKVDKTIASRCFASQNFLSNFSLLCCFILLAISLLSTSTNSYVLTHEGATQTYLHRRLAGRERREVQREILSLLGLRHRPRPNGARVIEKTSAPLYMIGLYNKVSTEHLDNVAELDSDQQTSSTSSGDSRQDSLWFQGRSKRRRHTRPRSAGPFGTDPDIGPFSPLLAPALSRYVEDSGILSNEVGVFDIGQSGARNPTSSAAAGSHNGMLTSEVERTLLADSDLVMSFVNTKSVNVIENLAQSDELRNIIRRHRSFYFDLSHVTPSDHLSAARFRLFKERSDEVLGNATLRINVYQVVSTPDGSASIYLLGSRLVGAGQTGWLVYDISTAVRDWLGFPSSNTGMKVTAETSDGIFVKPSRAGIIGRKGDPTKQAFLVTFFAHSDETNLSYHVRRRLRRSAASSTASGNQSVAQEDADGLGNNNTENSFDEAEDDTSDDETDYDSYDDNEDDHAEVTVGNSVPGEEVDVEASEEQTKRVRRRGKKKKKKRRKGKKKTKEHCHKRQLYVNFIDLQWDDWIIAPKGFPAYYCFGECGFPLNARMNATNHAIVQSLVHLVQPKRKLPKPCCSPTTLDAISVLYYNDDSNVVYKKYHDMVVNSCGCH